MVETANEPPRANTPATRGRVPRLASAVRVVLLVATVVALIGWGAFAVTTVVPNPNDSAGVFGAFQATSLGPSWPTETYNVPVNSTVNFVFDISYKPYSGCSSGTRPLVARNGTFAVLCWMPRPNSTLTSTWANYVSFNIASDFNCCRQTYFSWVSGPSGNLTASQGGGGFFQARQEGNYSAHVSNTVPLFPGAVPAGNVNGTLTFTLGHILFSRPYFAPGLATLGLAVVLSSHSLYSHHSSTKKRSSNQRERSSSHDPSRRVPEKIADLARTNAIG